MKNNTLASYLRIEDFFPNFTHQPGLGTGLGDYTFHPEFEKNGLFYTSHTEPGGSENPDFFYNDSIKVTLQWVVTEWKAENPKSSEFKGSYREIMRVNFVSGIHGMQELTFNRLAKKGDIDFGMLYIGLGDGGAVENGFPHIALHNGTRIWSSIIRIDPLGKNSENGKYGIPRDNPFVNEPSKRAELWAYGFRNPNKIFWHKDGRMFATEIGQANIEEINLINPCKFYGWPIREGSFKLNPYGNLSKVYALEAEDELEIQYPYLQFDHDEIAAIIGGHFMYDEEVETSRYILGNIVPGTVFIADFSAETPTVEKVNLTLDGEAIWHQDGCRLRSKIQWSILLHLHLADLG